MVPGGGELLVYTIYTRFGMTVKPEHTMNDFNQYYKFSVNSKSTSADDLSIFLFYRSPHSLDENNIKSDAQGL